MTVHFLSIECHYNLCFKFIILAGSLIFQSTADDEHWIYANGVEIGHFTFPTSGAALLAYDNPVTIPDNTSVVAVHIHNNGGLGGLLGSFSDGRVTDGSWKCTREFSEDWKSPSFDDSNWPAAATRDQDNPEWAKMTKVASSAKWIFAGSFSDDQISVYCRTRIVSKIKA